MSEEETTLTVGEDRENTEQPESGLRPRKTVRRKTSIGSQREDRPVMTIHVYSWATPIAALAALLIGLAGGYFFRPYAGNTTGGSDAPAAAIATAEPIDPQAALPATPPADIEARRQALMDALIAQTKHFLGNPDAPVTILEFSDFQCPYCGRFFQDVEPEIRKQYVESGQVRIGYLHFAFLGQESLWAAEASECAADQSAFWEYHDKLFNSQNGENRGTFNKNNLKAFAADLGLDTKTFNQCLDGGKYTEYVKSQVDVGRQIGVQSTPTFLVNGQAVVGAQPFEAFQQAIEGILGQ
ncbi:MAG: hypothetical protein Fur0018_01900 [Anaerolineales bacterium]